MACNSEEKIVALTERVLTLERMVCDAVDILEAQDLVQSEIIKRLDRLKATQDDGK